jgi:hypothetical protein
MGRPINDDSISEEITYFLLAQEYKWTPNQVKMMNNKDLKAIRVMTSSFNRTQSSQQNK